MVIIAFISLVLKTLSLYRFSQYYVSAVYATVEEGEFFPFQSNDAPVDNASVARAADVRFPFPCHGRQSRQRHAATDTA